MVDKNLNASIQLRYDTLNNWIANSSQILRKGEVACVEIPALDTTSGVTNPPTVIFKVGDGTTPFAKLAWSSALAADVHTWAKKTEQEFISWINTLTNQTLDIQLTDIRKYTDLLNKYLINSYGRQDIISNLNFTDSILDTIIENYTITYTENHTYGLEIINSDTGAKKSFEATAFIDTDLSSDTVIFINVPFVKDSESGELYIRQRYDVGRGISQHFYNTERYDLSISTTKQPSDTIKELLPADFSTGLDEIYNYVLANFKINLYEKTSIDELNIEIGAQVNKIDSVAKEFNITSKQLNINDNAISATHLKADANYLKEDAEVWIFDCGNSKF